MKFKIRQSIFETNSSSIHAIAIYKGNESINIPNTIFLDREEFGWEVNTTCNWQKKLNYIYEMCIKKDYKDDNLIFEGKEEKEEDEWLSGKKIKGFLEDSCLDKFIRILKNKDINVNYCLGSIYDGYIDHCDCWGNFINTLLNDEEKLLKFIFGTTSYLFTGNDNNNYACDSTPNKHEDFEIEYKYN